MCCDWVGKECGNRMRKSKNGRKEISVKKEN